MQKTLIDSGPLVALFDRNDDHHGEVLSFLKDFKGYLITTWPVLTEVSHLLDFSVNVQLDFYTWIQRGGLMMENLQASDVEEIIRLTSRYRDRPMDLADASLIVTAEKLGIREVLTLDKDFLIYRLSNKRAFNNLLKPGGF